jgi:hypothetical protein
MQYQRFVAALPAQDRPDTSNRGFVLGLSSALVFIGLVLAAALLV